jgi:hypothetical protein
MIRRLEKPFLTAVTVASAFLLLTACTEAPKTEAKTDAKAESEGPAQPITAKTAFWVMYKPAFKWAKDAEPLSMTGKDLPDMPMVDGKAGEWTAVFVAPSLKEARTLVYAVAGEHKGSTISAGVPWYGALPKSKPFLTSVFVVDSDAAFNTASGQAGDWLKKNPGKKPTVYLGSESRFANPVWYFIWGDPKNGYAAFVDATTGLALK